MEQEQNRLRKFWLYLLLGSAASEWTPPLVLVAGLRRRVHGWSAAKRVVPQSQVKLRFWKISTSSCSPWHWTEQA